MTKDELKQLAKEFLPDGDDPEIMDYDEMNQIREDRRRQLVEFVEFVMGKEGRKLIEKATV